MVERLYRTGFTNGHCHYYEHRSPYTFTRTADGHFHQIVFLDGRACIVQWEDGHTHEVDPEDRTPLPEVPFEPSV